ncbi:amidohydrolase family protein [uncultured Sphingomonas sp.]|uniref:amidohydrolase family protein n=1 Tax=uncultured Sphingomonas sp. TaxID=158754 RepID=UPI0025E147C6|nr:amidohydrolase family protein [uncultured Sphingomonas sp.]
MGSAQDLAVVHARAWTGSGAGPVEDATIVVRGGRIASVQAGTAPPAGLTVLDAGGRNVTPGLFAGATQVGLVEVAGAEDTTDEAVSSGKLGPAFDVAPAMNSNSLLVEQARSDGVLWAMSFPNGTPNSPFLGQSALLRLGGGSIVVRPRAAMFVRIGGSASFAAGGSRAAQWTLLRRALTEAGQLGSRGELPPDERLLGRYDLEALRPVAAGNMILAIQTHRESDIREAIRLARELRLRVVLVGGAEAWRVARELVVARIPVLVDPGANLPLSYDELGARADNAAILHRAGVTVAIIPSAHGIDMNYNVGVSSRMAAGLAVAAGLPYAAAIRSLTLAPAQIWGAEGTTGSLEPGKVADIAIWDGDPLEPGSAPSHMIRGGRPISTLTREQQLSRRYAPINKDDPWPPAYR